MRPIEERIAAFLANYQGDNRVLIQLLVEAETELIALRRQLAAYQEEETEQ